MLSAVSHTVVRRPSGATAGLITVEFNYELSYITTESLISIHPLAPLTRWHHAVCAQSAYRVHTAIVLSGNERSRFTLDLDLASMTQCQFNSTGSYIVHVKCCRNANVSIHCTEVVPWYR